MLLATPGGLAVAAPGRPDRVPVSLPPGPWQPTAAVGPHGAVLLVSAAVAPPVTVLEGVLTGTHVRTAWTASLPLVVGPAVQAGCVAADGAATVIADRLVYLRAGAVAGMHEVPATAGRCQMTDAGSVAYLAEVDHAVAFWDPGTGATVVTATRCDDLGLGGGLLACLIAGSGDVVVGRLRAPVAGQAALDAGVGGAAAGSGAPGGAVAGWAVDRAGEPRRRRRHDVPAPRERRLCTLPARSTWRRARRSWGSSSREAGRGPTRAGQAVAASAGAATPAGPSLASSDVCAA